MNVEMTKKSRTASGPIKPVLQKKKKKKKKSQLDIIQPSWLV